MLSFSSCFMKPGAASVLPAGIVRQSWTNVGPLVSSPGTWYSSTIVIVACSGTLLLVPEHGTAVCMLSQALDSPLVPSLAMSQSGATPSFGCFTDTHRKPRAAPVQL